MANFRSHVLNMAGTRLVPTHSLAFRPECYSRVLHPTQTYRPLPRQVGGQGGSAAPRGHPPSGALQHAVPYTPEGCGTAPGGLPHQTHTLREVPRCANRYLLGAYRYKNRRPRPPTMWTDMILVICYTIQGTGLPTGQNEFRHNVAPKVSPTGV
jgi:hypothetical protein